MSSTSPHEDGNAPEYPLKPSRGRSSSRTRTERLVQEQRSRSSFLPSESPSAGQAEKSQPPGSHAPFNLPPVGSAARALLDEDSSEEETEETTESFVKFLEKDEEGRSRMRAQKKELLQMESRMQGRKAIQQLQSNEQPPSVSTKPGDMDPPPRSSGPRKPLTRHSFSARTRADGATGTPPAFNFRHPIPPAVNQQLGITSAGPRVSPNVQNLQPPGNKILGLPEHFGQRGREYKSPYTSRPGSRPGSGATQQENEVHPEESPDDSFGKTGPPKPRSQSLSAAQKRFHVVKSDFFDASSSEAKRGEFASHWVKFVDKAWDLLSFEMICGGCKQVVECEGAEKIAVGLKGDLWKTRGEESIHVKAETLDEFQRRTGAVLNAIMDREGEVGRIEWD
ncbi:hypothetical protein BKA61DRAFT_573435 [Leptodontidium sp. MPI-SDFR-AT-0119]|nr:hypothetical protein BKA61DRAFT_573435 [Leptodontidium sp. MPI-SDFR-AT-0119]